jgi:tetratricopeptide (TPR) repeat protein
MRLALILAIAATTLAAASGSLEQARDRQDRTALQKQIDAATAAAAKAPNDPEAQFRAALALSYLAEVMIEQRERKPARPVAEQGIKLAEKAVALKASSAEYHRILAILYGQAITDVMSGLSYGPKAKAAVNKAMELAPKSSMVWVAQGVGSYYLPAALGGGTQNAIASLRKAIELDPKNAEAYLWLGVSLRKENKDAEARQALSKALELNPNRIWVKQQLEKTPAK